MLSKDLEGTTLPAELFLWSSPKPFSGYATRLAINDHLTYLVIIRAGWWDLFPPAPYTEVISFLIWKNCKPKQGARDSNSDQRFWRPLCYRYTNALYFRFYGRCDNLAGNARNYCSFIYTRILFIYVTS